MSDLKITIAGAGGRMGLANVLALHAMEGVTLHAALDRAGSPAIGKDAGTLAGLEPLGVLVSRRQSQQRWPEPTPSSIFLPPRPASPSPQKPRGAALSMWWGPRGAARTMRPPSGRAADAGARIVKSGNFSLGVNMLAGLVRQAAALLAGYDIEVLEMHHKGKVDAPSGTALMLGEAAAQGRGVDLAN